jgi:serine/threonine protein kinase
VHRDVSPQNILVSTEGEVKLADFGIALTEGRARWTLPGCVKGKCGYMAPEQIRGERLDGTTDLFAVGVVLYELLTGVRPCDPRRGMDELHATVRGQGVPLKIRAPELPPVLSEAVDRLLSPDREARFRHPEEAVLALAAFGAGDAGPIILGQKVRTRTHSGSKVKTESCTIPMETGVLHA